MGQVAGDTQSFNQLNELDLFVFSILKWVLVRTASAELNLTEYLEEKLQKSLGTLKLRDN